MDVNRLLCVGRSDMYGTVSGVPKQQFHPAVSSFKMDSLRASVRKDKPESGSSSSRSRNSSRSPSKSILRGQIGSPKNGSPQGRNVRFNDRHDGRDSPTEFAKIHVKETTQTNGYYTPTTVDTAVQVYYKSGDNRTDKKEEHSTLELEHPNWTDNDFKSPPLFSSTPRTTGDRSPVRNAGYSKHHEPEIKQQRELPRTPAPRVIESKIHSQDHVNEQRFVEAMSVCRDNKSPRYPPSQQRLASSTQTPSAPSGQKIIQNLDFGAHQIPVPREYKKVQKLELADGSKIIKNMQLRKLQTDNSIGVQTQFDVQSKAEPCIQVRRDVESQTPREVSVQTPSEDEMAMDYGASADDPNMTGDSVNISHSYAQTMSEDEEDESKDAGCQTPRDVGVQTPRTVSIQTSDTSDDEDTATAAVQTPSEPGGNRITQNMDIYTNIWSNTKSKEPVPFRSYGDDNSKTSQQTSSFHSSREDVDSRIAEQIIKPNFKDLLTEESDDDDEIDLPAHLTQPFPQKGRVYAYDKQKTSTVGTGTGYDNCDSNNGVLLEHSAKQLLERRNVPKPQSGKMSPKMNGTLAFKPREPFAGISSPQNGTFTETESVPYREITSTRQPTSATNVNNRQFRNKQHFESSQPLQDRFDAGTQFHSEYHLDLQAEEDRINEIATTLDFTPIETHSFDPGHSPVPVMARNDPRDCHENQMRNSIIKDVELGPIPLAIEDRHDRRITDYSPPRQRFVKSVNFGGSVRDRYRDNVGPNYLFFKNTAHGSRYETFEPQPRQTARRPTSSKTSPQKIVQFRERPYSAPATPRQSYPSKVGHLTPALSHIRNEAIRKSVSDSPWASSNSHQNHPSRYQLSDTFISSTNLHSQPLTVPVSPVAPTYSAAGSWLSDAGSYETLGNQPRYVVDLNAAANCRPEPKRKSRTPSPSFRLQDNAGRMITDTHPISSALHHAGKAGNSIPIGSDLGSEGSFSSSCKPPLPRGRAQKRGQQSFRNSSRESKRGVSPGVKGETYSEPKSQSVDSARQTSRDQGTATESRQISSTPTSDSNHQQTETVSDRHSDTESAFLNNEAIQKIIEQANLSM